MPAPTPDLLALLGAVLDDARPADERRAALAVVGASGDARSLPFLAAAADRADPALAPAVADAALRLSDPAGARVVQRALRVDRLPRAEADRLVAALAAAPTAESGDTLWDLASDREVPARVRSLSARTLAAARPEVLARLGPPSAVPDLLGGALFVAGGATAGGVVLGALGSMGEWEAGPAVGAIGGSVVGAGVAGLRLAGRPATAGEGLALASGAAWGVTAGVWTGNVAYGSAQYVGWPRAEEVRAPRAGLLAAGTLAGTALGYLGARARPTALDVLEADLAGYLTQGLAGGLVLLAFPTPLGRPTEAASFPSTTLDVTSSTRSGPFVDPYEEHRRHSQRYAAAELLGSAAGLGVGSVLAPRWSLDANDLAFAAVLGAEATWLGATVPELVGVDEDELRGLFWFPSHGGALLGLSVAELLPSSPGRTLATGFGAGVGGAFGGGLLLVQGYDDERSVALGTAPGSLVGAVAGWAVAPLLSATPGDAATVGVATGIAGSAGAMLGAGLRERRVWRDPSQAVGLGLLATGVTGVGALALAPVMEAQVDSALFVGSAAGLGALYGGLGTAALGGDDATAWFAAAGGETVATGVAALLVSERVGLAPRRALVPEVGAVTGATVGALGTALFSGEGRSVSTGTVVGATAGLAAGVVAEVALRPLDRRAAIGPLRGPSARVVPSVGRSRDGAPLVAVSVDGW